MRRFAISLPKLLNGESPYGDVGTRLVDAWRILLPGVAGRGLLPHFEGVLADIAERYRQVGVLGA